MRILAVTQNTTYVVIFLFSGLLLVDKTFFCASPTIYAFVYKY